MGSHASQVNPVERWKLVHYVEKLIGKEQGPAAAEAGAEEGMEEGAAEGEEGMQDVDGDNQGVEEAHEDGADH